MALTEITIKALKPSSKEQKVYDGGGLYPSIMWLQQRLFA